MKPIKIISFLICIIGIMFGCVSANAENVTSIPQGAVTVKSFGAVGDGVTDDTEAFVTALNELNGETLYIPEGTYIVNGGVLLDGININIVGVGNPMIQLVTEKTNTRCMDFRNAQSINITGVSFDAYRLVYGEQGNIACMYIIDSNNVNINNCRFQNCYKEGITLTSLKGVGNNLLENISITDNTFYNTSDNVWVKCKVKNFNFSNNTSELSIGTGVEFISGEFCEDVVISGNSFKDFRNGNAIKILDAKNLKITGNRMENCIFGIRVFVSDNLIDNVYSCENILISENTFVNGAENKACTPIIFLTPSTYDGSRYLYNNIEVASNVIETTNGITVSYVENLSIHDNKINLNGDSTAYVLNTCNNVEIANEAPILVKSTMCRSNNTKNIYLDNVDYDKTLFYVQNSAVNVYLTNMAAHLNMK